MQAASEAPLRMPRHFKKPTSPELIGNIVDNVPWSFHRPIPLDINLKVTMRRSSRILLRNNSVSSRTRQRSVRTNKKTRPTPFRNKTSRKNCSNSSADVKPDDCKGENTKTKQKNKIVKRRPSAPEQSNEAAQAANIEILTTKSRAEMLVKDSKIDDKSSEEIEKSDETSIEIRDIKTEIFTTEMLDGLKRSDPFKQDEEDFKKFMQIAGATSNRVERALKNLSPKKSLLINDGKTTRSGRQFSPYDFDSFNLFHSPSNDIDQSISKSAPSSSPGHNILEKPSKRKRGKNIDNWPSLKKKFRETESGTVESEEFQNTDLHDFLPTENKENPPAERDLFADEDVAFLIGEPPTLSRPEGHRLPPDFFNITCPSDFEFEIAWPLDYEWKDVYSYKKPPHDMDKDDIYSKTYPNLKDVATFSVKRYKDRSEMESLSKISLSDTALYQFQSVFKDVHSQIAHFENKTGHLQGTGDGRKFDIQETEKDEKKRLYRKKITDSNLIAWHEYIVASSTKYTPDDNVPTPRPVIRLPWMNCPRGDQVWRLNNTRPLPTVDDFFRGLTNCRKRKC